MRLFPQIKFNLHNQSEVACSKAGDRRDKRVIEKDCARVEVVGLSPSLCLSLSPAPIREPFVYFIDRAVTSTDSH